MKHVRIYQIAAAGLLALSVTGCIKPPLDMPSSAVIQSNDDSLNPPDCSRLERSSLLTDAGFHRPSMEWGCATYTNLAAQIADPEVLTRPRTLGPADAALAASAVRRYETGRATGVDTSSSRDSK